MQVWINVCFWCEESSRIEDSIVQIVPNYVNTRRGKADTEINIQKGFIQTTKVSAIVVKELSYFYLPSGLDANMVWKVLKMVGTQMRKLFFNNNILN